MASYRFSGRGPWTLERLEAGLTVLFGTTGRGPRADHDFWRYWSGVAGTLSSCGLEVKADGTPSVYIVGDSQKTADLRAILEQWEKEDAAANEDPSPAE